MLISEQTKHCGQVLAKMGDEFFKSYTPTQRSASAGLYQFQYLYFWAFTFLK